MGLLHTLLTTTILGKAGTAWNPWDNLFEGQTGIALDFSDISTLYTDETFSTNITTYGDPVGGVIDKSQGGVLGANLATAANAAETDVNGTAGFIAGGANLTSQSSVTSGSSFAMLAESNTTPTASARVYKDLNSLGIADGTLVEVAVDLRHVGSGGQWVVLIGAANSSTTGTSIVTLSNSNTSFNTYTVRFVYTLAATRYFIAREISGTDDGGVYIDNLSVKELPGNHLIQSTSTARPIYTRHPKSGVRNTLDYSEELDNAIYYATGIEEYGVTDPLGGSTALRVNYSGAQYVRWGRQSDIAYETGVTYTAFFWARSDNPAEIHLCPSSGTLRSYPFTATATWTRYDHTWVGDASDVHLRFQDRTGQVSSLELAFLQLEVNASATAYQTRVSQYDVTETGVDDCFGLTFDGVDDWMYTAANLDLSGTDKTTQCLGGYNPGIADGKAYQHGGFDLNGGSSTSYNTTNITAGGKGTVNAAVSATVSTPVYAVSSMTFDTALGVGAALSLSVDGGPAAYSAQDPLGGQLADAVFQLGSRNGGNQRLTGAIYGITITDYILDADQLDSLEAWTAANTPEVTLA